LTTLEQKLELLEAEGIDLVVLESFTPGFAQTPPQQFVREFVHRRIRPLEVYVGYDFHFGRDREGSMRLLTEMGPRLGFAVTIIPEVTIEDQDVNSTRIRALLAKGSAEQAAHLLGREYTIRGKVVEGDGRGRALGFPTANLEAENEVLPARGVYAAWVRCSQPDGRVGSQRFAAVANLGHRPTFDSTPLLVVEAHLLDFHGDLYGQRLDLAFVKRLRSERRFANPEALRAQIARDVAEARSALEPA
jgi:riboflavin kinase/FMN adenylyltransferase